MSDELIELTLDDAKARLEKAVEHAKQDFAAVRTGRANSGLVEKLPVDYFGAIVPLQQLAGFSVPEARQLVITPFDKTTINIIEKAIQEANLGLNPSNDGNAIRLIFPVLTEERRKEFVRLVKKAAEENKNSLRNGRREARKALESFEKDGEISEDDRHRAEAELDKMTKTAEDAIDAALLHKTNELLER